MARYSAVTRDTEQQRLLVAQNAQDRRDHCITRQEARQLASTTVRVDVLDPTGPGERAVRLGIDRAVIARCPALRDALLYSVPPSNDPGTPFRLRAKLFTVLAWRDGPVESAALELRRHLRQMEVWRACRCPFWSLCNC